MKRYLSLLLVILCVGLMFVACSNKVENIRVKSETGAIVSLSFNEISSHKVFASETDVDVSVSDGTVNISLVSQSEADVLRMTYSAASNQFTELTTAAGIGFGYVLEDKYIHVIPVDTTTCLYLVSASEDALFNVEGKLSFTSIAEGKDVNADEWSSHFG